MWCGGRDIFGLFTHYLTAHKAMCFIPIVANYKVAPSALDYASLPTVQSMSKPAVWIFHPPAHFKYLEATSEYT